MQNKEMNIIKMPFIIYYKVQISKRSTFVTYEILRFCKALLNEHVCYYRLLIVRIKIGIHIEEKWLRKFVSNTTNIIWINQRLIRRFK